MSPTRVLRAALVTMLVASGCADDSTTGVPAADLEQVADLALVFPTLTPESVTPTEIRELEPPPRPAAALDNGDVSDGTEEPVIDESVGARIMGAATNVGFTAAYAYSTGRHSYTGNVGNVETVATVSFSGESIGSRAASRQDYTPYLLDWGAVKSIWVEAYVFTDQKCGLRVDGDSTHKAWWQWFMGGPAPRWGDASVTSQAFPPAEQLSCEEVALGIEGYSGDGKDAGSDGSGWVTCWYWVTYDPETGEIYDASFLFCEGGDEGG